jgi:molybdopterin synthase catalytic subunit
MLEDHASSTSSMSPEHATDHDIYAVGPEILRLEPLADQIRSNSAGALVTFSGTTRDHFQGMP